MKRKKHRLSSLEHLFWGEYDSFGSEYESNCGFHKVLQIEDIFNHYYGNKNLANSVINMAIKYKSIAYKDNDKSPNKYEQERGIYHGYYMPCYYK